MPVSQIRPAQSEGVSLSLLIETAREKNINPAFYAAIRGSEHVHNEQLWSPPAQPTSDTLKQPVKLNMDDSDCLLNQVANELALSIKFPIASAHLHSLGVIASAMVKSFSFEYNGSIKPCNLYVATGQPPSTGKSGVNDYLFEPVQEAFDRLNKTSAITRKRLEIQLAQAEKDLDSMSSGKKTSTDDDLNMSLTLVDDIKHELSRNPEWIPSLDDVTIEAAEGLAGKQNGVFNIVSAEAEALNVILGAVYKGADSKSNFGIVLKAWDGERISVARITRDGYKGKVKSSIAVIAQTSTIESLMQLGAEGRGLPERFLMLNEPNMLGSRNHNEYRPICPKTTSEYKFLIESIVLQGRTVLTLKPEYIKLINNYRNELEPEIADGGKYDSAMLTGFAGKADKHILKLACIYHVAREWSSQGTKNTEVSEHAIRRAISTFKVLMNEYAQSAIEYGFAGKVAQLDALCAYLHSQVTSKRRKKVNFREFRDSIKGLKPFKGVRNLNKKLKDELMPVLEECNYCILQDGIVYINPRLK